MATPWQPLGPAAQSSRTLAQRPVRPQGPGHHSGVVGLHAPAETIGSHQCISVQWHPMLIDNNVGQSVLITHLKGAELRRRMLGHGP